MTTGGGLGTAAALGAASGLAGVAAMTLAEKLEQLLTHRPNTYVVDLVHKSVFSLATGAAADALIEPSPRSSARRRDLGTRRKGFA